MVQEKPHRLAWFINQIYPYDFQRQNDYSLSLSPDETSEHEFPLFLFDDEENRLMYHLVANKSEGSYLIPEWKNFDYLILISGAIDFFNETEFKKSISKVPVIQLVYQLDAETVKSKNNLVLLFES